MCVDNTSHLKNLAVESTLSRVKEKHVTEAVVVNTSGVPIFLKHGVCRSCCLVYGTQVASEPADFPSFFVSGIINQANDLTKAQTSLEPLLEVAHYTKMKPALLNILKSHRNALALSGEPLEVTKCAEHHIK